MGITLYLLCYDCKIITEVRRYSACPCCDGTYVSTRYGRLTNDGLYALANIPNVSFIDSDGFEHERRGFVYDVAVPARFVIDFFRNNRLNNIEITTKQVIINLTDWLKDNDIETYYLNDEHRHANIYDLDNQISFIHRFDYPNCFEVLPPNGEIMLVAEYCFWAKFKSEIDAIKFKLRWG